jgi:hypothetical protein
VLSHDIRSRDLKLVNAIIPTLISSQPPQNPAALRKDIYNVPFDVKDKNTPKGRRRRF